MKEWGRRSEEVMGTGRREQSRFISHQKVNYYYYYYYYKSHFCIPRGAQSLFASDIFISKLLLDLKLRLTGEGLGDEVEEKKRRRGKKERKKRRCPLT